MEVNRKRSPLDGPGDVIAFIAQIERALENVALPPGVFVSVEVPFTTARRLAIEINKSNPNYKEPVVTVLEVGQRFSVALRMRNND